MFQNSNTSYFEPNSTEESTSNCTGVNKAQPDAVNVELTDCYVIQFNDSTGFTTYEGYGLVEGRAGLIDALLEMGGDAVAIKVTRLADGLCRDWTEDALKFWCDELVEASEEGRSHTVPPVLEDEFDHRIREIVAAEQGLAWRGFVKAIAAG